MKKVVSANNEYFLVIIKKRKIAMIYRYKYKYIIQLFLFMSHVRYCL